MSDSTETRALPSRSQASAWAESAARYGGVVGMGSVVAAVAVALSLALVGCGASGGSARGDADGEAVGPLIEELRSRVDDGRGRCSPVDRDPSTVEPLPEPVAEVVCQVDGVAVVISQYESSEDIEVMGEIACDLAGGPFTYSYVSEGRWLVEVEADDDPGVVPDDVLAPIADRLGAEVEQLECS